MLYHSYNPLNVWGKIHDRLEGHFNYTITWQSRHLCIRSFTYSATAFLCLSEWMFGSIRDNSSAVRRSAAIQRISSYEEECCVTYTDLFSVKPKGCDTPSKQANPLSFSPSLSLKNIHTCMSLFLYSYTPMMFYSHIIWMTCNTFCQICRLTINVDKTKMMAIKTTQPGN